jgi:hypothetical protein
LVELSWLILENVVEIGVFGYVPVCNEFGDTFATVRFDPKTPTIINVMAKSSSKQF